MEAVVDPIFLPTPQHSSSERLALSSAQGQVTAKEKKQYYYKPSLHNTSQI